MRPVATEARRTRGCTELTTSLPSVNVRSTRVFRTTKCYPQITSVHPYRPRAASRGEGHAPDRFAVAQGFTRRYRGEHPGGCLRRLDRPRPREPAGAGLEAPEAARRLAAPTSAPCGNLAAEAGSKLAYQVYAVGVQIYQWNGTSWAFLGPSATLYANANAQGVIGTHYAGPTWESNSGGTVVATVRDRCPRDAADIPWLLLDAASHSGPGIFHDIDQIQRVNTVGGQAPAEAGAVGEVRNVAYTAEYYFWRAP